MYVKLYVNITVVIITAILISYYSLNLKTIYPKIVIEIFAEPLGRLLAYLTVYMISFYNELLGLLFLIPVVLLHLDIINLIKT